jgi:hypothetical protein
MASTLGSLTNITDHQSPYGGVEVPAYRISKTFYTKITRNMMCDTGYGDAYFSRASLHTKPGEQDLATKDIKMTTHLTEVNIETFAKFKNLTATDL